jgi:hypothetical protein
MTMRTSRTAVTTQVTMVSAVDMLTSSSVTDDSGYSCSIFGARSW